MVNCQQAFELIGDFVDSDLSLKGRTRLRLHLLICRHCRRYFSSYRATIRAEKNAFLDVDEPGADEIPDDLIAAILMDIDAR